MFILEIVSRTSMNVMVVITTFNIIYCFIKTCTGDISTIHIVYPALYIMLTLHCI